MKCSQHRLQGCFRRPSSGGGISPVRGMTEGRRVGTVAAVKRVVPTLPDAIVAVAIAAVEVGGAALTASKDGEPRLTVTAVALLLVQSLPVAWARRAPVPVWLITAVGALVYGARDYPDPFLPLGPIAALFLVVATQPRRIALFIGVCSLGIAVVGTALAGDSDAQDFA